MSPTASLSQNDRILRALRRGPVTQGDFLPPVCDGLPTISRVGARIHNLKARGHRIEATGRDESGCAVYRLVREAEASDRGDASGFQSPQPDARAVHSASGSPSPCDASLDSFRGPIASAASVSPSPPALAATPSPPRCRYAGCPNAAANPFTGFCAEHDEDRLDLAAEYARGDLDDPPEIDPDPDDDREPMDGWEQFER